MIYGPHYQGLRKQVLEEQPYCATCDRTENLQCHHRHYKNFPEREKREDLVMLCKECHDAITNVHRSRRDLSLPALRENTPLPRADRPEVVVETKVTVCGLAASAPAKPEIKEFKV